MDPSADLNANITIAELSEFLANTSEEEIRELAARAAQQRPIRARRSLPHNRAIRRDRNMQRHLDAYRRVYPYSMASRSQLVEAYNLRMDENANARRETLNANRNRQSRSNIQNEIKQNALNRMRDREMNVLQNSYEEDYVRPGNRLDRERELVLEGREGDQRIRQNEIEAILLENAEREDREVFADTAFNYDMYGSNPDLDTEIDLDEMFDVIDFIPE